MDNQNNYNGIILTKQTSKIRAMTITSCLLAASILISFISNFIKISFLGDFLTLDLSLVFIIPLIFICNVYWSLLSGVICGLFSFAWSAGLWIGPLLNITVNILTILLVYLFYFKVFRIIKNKQIKKTIVNNKVVFNLNNYFYFYIKLIITLLLTLIITTLVMAFLNGIVFTPLYWWAYNLLDSPSFVIANKWYKDNGPNLYLLYLPDYWSGIFGLYTSFNVFKLSIVFILVYFPITIIVKSDLANKYFYRRKM